MPSLRVRTTVLAVVAFVVMGCGTHLGPAQESRTNGSRATALAAGAGAAPESFPADDQFFAIRCADGSLGDPVDDPVTGNGDRDIVGNAQFPAFYRAATDTHLFFRLRLNLDPRKPSGNALLPSSWDILFDVDGDVRTYEYMLTVDGNLNGTKARWVRNSVQEPTNPADPANDDPAHDLLHDLTPASAFYSVTEASDGSKFGGNPDYFITIAVPVSDLTDLGIDLSKPLVVWGGTSAQNYTLNADVTCSPGFPTSLDKVAPPPVSLDPGVPDAAPDVATVTEDGSVTTNVLQNDFGLRDAPLTVTIEIPPTHGTAVVEGDNSITYTPEPNWSGSDSYTYRVSDADGQTSTAVVNVTGAPVDDGPPIATADTVQGYEDTPVTTAVLGNDTILDGWTTVTLVDPPVHGTATVNGDGTITYQPSANWNGVDSYTYSVTDTDGQTSTAVVTVSIAPVNDAPVAVEDNATAIAGGPVITIDVLANDVDIDGESLTIASLTQPERGSVVLDGNTVRYQAPAAFTGIDAFTYTATDSHGVSSTAAVTVTVNASTPSAPPAVVPPTTTIEPSSDGTGDPSPGATGTIRFGVAGGGCSSSPGSSATTIPALIVALSVTRLRRRRRV